MLSHQWDRTGAYKVMLLKEKYSKGDDLLLLTSRRVNFFFFWGGGGGGGGLFTKGRSKLRHMHISKHSVSEQTGYRIKTLCHMCLESLVQK